MAYSESPFSSTSSSYRRRWKYDVFLSFRGEDTRKQFTDHLYVALEQAGINTFRDDKKLPRGEETPPQVLRAIEGSRISVVIFSRNYASSRWCLDELVRIMECRHKTHQVVLPIFYDTDPSDVRKQTGSYAKAFDEHEEHFKEEMEKVNRWREALAQAGNLSGRVLHNETNRYEAKFIKKVLIDVACKLVNKTLHVAKHPGGISSKNMVRGRTEPVEEHDVENSGRLLQPGAGATSFRILEDNPSETRGAPLLSGSTRLVGQAFEENKNVIWSLLMDDEVSTIGIYGMGGAGKTTMLKHIYEEEGQRREQVISATEPISNISPNGRFRRVFTYWEKGELLGRGSFASVYEGISDDGLFFAVKEVSLLDQGTQGKQSIYQLEQEIALLSRFEHENIVQYYGTDKDESKLYIFLELVTKGSLQKLYQTYKLRDSQVSSYTRQILHGLKYLHDQKVVHRDIKCANLLVDANGSVKLADFGLAKATKLNDVKSCKGTAFWMAPEVVNNKNQGYGLSADIWSLGCTVLEMLTRQIPYSELEFMQALFKIGKGVPPLVPDSLSNDARDFILQCLQVNPNDRPTAAVLLDHPFVKKNLSTSLGSASIIEV